MTFEFATAGRIRFGPGTVKELTSSASALGRRAFVVTGRSQNRAAAVLDDLLRAGLDPVPFRVEREPTVEKVADGLGLARASACDVVIAVGGGSVIDTGKAVAALLTNEGELEDYLEVVGRGKPISVPPRPFIAVPTTAGTGAEVTRNAVVTSVKHGVKVSLRSPLMLPRLALVDPELTHSLPPEITASTGLDALTQVLEPFVCVGPTPLTDAVCREGLARAARSLLPAYRDGRDPAARQDMALASLLGGIALANAKLGAVHGFAGPIGGMFADAPHGAICGRLLPSVMEANIRALAERIPDSESLGRYDEVARILTGDSRATASDGVSWVRRLCQDLRVKPLREFGLSEQHVPTVVERAVRASSMKGNPVQLTVEESTEVLREAL